MSEFQVTTTKLKQEVGNEKAIENEIYIPIIVVKRQLLFN